MSENKSARQGGRATGILGRYWLPSLVALVAVAAPLFLALEKEAVERLSFLATFLGPFITVGGFFFIVRQLHGEKQALETQTNWEMYGSSIGVLNTFVEHPELRPYFYDARRLPAPSDNAHDDALRSKILAAAEVMADHLENIVNSGEDRVIDRDTYCVWIRYMKLMGRRSEALREILNDQPHPHVDVAGTGVGEGIRYNELLRRIVRDGYCPAADEPARSQCASCGAACRPALASA